MDNERLDLWHTDEAKCPYCGFEDYDSWELDIDEDVEAITECPSCGKTYGVMRNVEITYTTWELKQEVINNERPKNIYQKHRTRSY